MVKKRLLFQKAGKLLLVKIIILVLISGFLRFYKLSTVPPGLYIDEISIGYNAYSILQTGKDEHGKVLPLIYEAFGEYKLPVYIYYTTASLAIFGNNEFAIRFPSALFGTLTVILMYFMVAETYPKLKKTWLPFFSSLLLALSPWHIHFSHAGFEANLGLFFLVSGMLSLLQAGRGRRFSLMISAVSFLFSFYTYNSMRLFAPLMFIAIAVIFRKTIFTIHRKELGLTCLIIFLFLLPFFSQLISKQAIVRFNSENIFRESDPVDNFISNYFANFDTTFLFFRGDQNGRHSVRKLGMLYLFELPLIVFGLKELLSTRSKGNNLLLTWLILGPLPSSLTTINPHALRSLHMAPVWHIISALGFFVLIRSIDMHYKKLKKIIVICFSFLAIFNISLYLHQYYVHYPNETALDWQSGTKEVVQLIGEKYDQYADIYVTDVISPQYLGFFLPIRPDVYQHSAVFKKIGKIIYFSNLDELPKDAENKSLVVSHWWQKPEDGRDFTEIRMLNRDVAYNVWEL